MHIGTLIVLEIKYYILAVPNISDAETFLNVAEMLSATNLTILSPFLVTVMLYNRKPIGNSVEILRSFWPSMEDPEMKKFAINTVVKTKQFCLFYMSQILTLSITWCMIPLYFLFRNLYINYYEDETRHWNTDLQLPFYIWYPYDFSGNWWVYTLTYISQFVAGE